MPRMVLDFSARILPGSIFVTMRGECGIPFENFEKVTTISQQFMGLCRLGGNGNGNGDCMLASEAFQSQYRVSQSMETSPYNVKGVLKISLELVV